LAQDGHRLSERILLGLKWLPEQRYEPGREVPHLRRNALDDVYEDEGTIYQSRRSGHFARKVDVPRCIDHIYNIRP
jgi:hypothetical protein